jgi:dihydrofolate reductase
MSGPDRIEGFAIVSADGMLADATGVQPDVLRIDADQKFFRANLARADVLAHGRNSGEGGPQAASKLRLILTRKIAALVRDKQNPNILHWNPAGASLEQAWQMLAPKGGVLAIIGGTDVFGHFLEHGYDVFYLSRVPGAQLPGGRPVFPEVPARTPEDLLASHGLRPDPPTTLDTKSGTTLVAWRR